MEEQNPNDLHRQQLKNDYYWWNHNVVALTKIYNHRTLLLIVVAKARLRRRRRSATWVTTRWWKLMRRTRTVGKEVEGGGAPRGVGEQRIQRRVYSKETSTAMSTRLGRGLQWRIWPCKSSTLDLGCNAPPRRVRERYCDVHTQASITRVCTLSINIIHKSEYENT